MKLLVSTEDRRLEGEVTGLELFTAYTVVVGRIIARDYVRPRYHTTLEEFLSTERVDVLLCTAILPTVQKSLESAGMEVHLLAQQDSDAAVAHYLAHELDNITVGDPVAGECLGNCSTCAHPCR